MLFVILDHEALTSPYCRHEWDRARERKISIVSIMNTYNNTERNNIINSIQDQYSCLKKNCVIQYNENKGRKIYEEQAKNSCV